MSNSTGDDVNIIISYQIRFWLYLIFEVPSLLCSFFVLFHLLYGRTLRHALNNHIVIILLILNIIVQVTNIPWIMYYYRTGHVILSTYTFCFIWDLIDECSAITTTLVFAWATIKRHILIFHDQWVSTRFKRLCCHYIPTGLLLLYCFCYCLVVIVFPPCENIYDYSQVGCGYVICYYNETRTGIWDTIVDHLIPTVIIILFSSLLLVRILYQKKRIHQPICWRQHRKMGVQLLSISILYLTLNIPNRIMEFAYFCGLSEDVGVDFMTLADFFGYYIYLLFPFVCAGSLPNLKAKVKNMLAWEKRRARVVATTEFPGRREKIQSAR